MLFQELTLFQSNVVSDNCSEGFYFKKPEFVKERGDSAQGSESEDLWSRNIIKYAFYFYVLKMFPTLNISCLQF